MPTHRRAAPPIPARLSAGRVMYHPRWRRYGDTLYAALILLAFLAEAAALALIVIAYPLRMVPAMPAARFQILLICSIVIVALCVWALGVYALGYHAFSERRTRAALRAQREWTGRWKRMLRGESFADPQLPDDAITALLRLMDASSDHELARLHGVARRYHVGSRLRPQVGSPWLSVRLEALDAMAKIRLPEMMPLVLAHVSDANPAVRVMAGRAAARTIAAVPAGRTRDRWALAFADRLSMSVHPPAVMEELLLLAWEAAPLIISRILDHGRAVQPLRAAMTVAGGLRLRHLGNAVAGFSDHPNPEIRAAAFKALAALDHHAQAARTAVRAGLTDNVQFVRVQATRAAALLPQDARVGVLVERLGDRNWWVRRAAAETLANLGEPGYAVLRRVAAHRTDPFARQIAVQTLLDRGVFDGPSARRMLSTA